MRLLFAVFVSVFAFVFVRVFVFVRERIETFQIDDDYLVCVINGRFPFVNVTQVSCGGF